jgi:type II secretory pathway pseudopilin PulG
VEPKMHHISVIMTSDTKIRPHKAKTEMKCNGSGLDQQTGFSTLELAVVITISLILAASAVPAITSAVNMAHLRGAASDLAALYEQNRILAIRDNSYYSSYILAATGTSQVAQAYVDLPQGSPAVTNGGTAVAAGDPEITIPKDVVLEPVGSAPNTAALESLLLPATTPVTPTDSSASAVTFGPRGLPCTPLNISGGGTVCDSSGGATAYWTFLENTKSSSWQAVTITPAGRVQKWYYNGSVWTKL